MWGFISFFRDFQGFFENVRQTGPAARLLPLSTVKIDKDALQQKFTANA